MSKNMARAPEPFHTPAALEEPAPESVDDEENVPESAPCLPDGVQMHWAGHPPVPALVVREEFDPGMRVNPPTGWQGAYERCGGCGDFLYPQVKACPRCVTEAPAGPQNMMIATPLKAVAQ